MAIIVLQCSLLFGLFLCNGRRRCHQSKRIGATSATNGSWMHSAAGTGLQRSRRDLLSYCSNRRRPMSNMLFFFLSAPQQQQKQNCDDRVRYVSPLSNTNLQLLKERRLGAFRWIRILEFYSWKSRFALRLSRIAAPAHSPQDGRIWFIYIVTQMDGGTEKLLLYNTNIGFKSWERMSFAGVC